MKHIAAIEIHPWSGDDTDYCLIKIFSPNLEKSIDFSFNMEYLFEWVNDEHRELFVEEICLRMLKREVSENDFTWNVDFKNIVKIMFDLWKK